MSERKLVAVGEVHEQTVRIVYLCASCGERIREETVAREPTHTGHDTLLSHGMCKHCAAKILEEAGAT